MFVQILMISNSQVTPNGGVSNTPTVFFVEEVGHPKKGGWPGYDTILQVLVRLLFLISGMYGITIQCYYAHVHFDSNTV